MLSAPTRLRNCNSSISNLLLMRSIAAVILQEPLSIITNSPDKRKIMINKKGIKITEPKKKKDAKKERNNQEK